MRVLRPGQPVHTLQGRGKSARKQADELFSKLIRLRDRTCRRCNTLHGLQCAHLVSRRYIATRWSEDNAIALCLRCHKWQTEHPLEGNAFFEYLVGAEKLTDLTFRAMAGAGSTDYKLLLAVLRSRLRELEAA